MGHVRIDPAAELDPASDGVSVDDRANACLPTWIMGLVADPDLVLLARIEPVSVDIGLVFLAGFVPELDGADRFSIVDQLLIRKRAFPVILPPLRLALAPMPIEAVGQQVVGLLLI